MSKENAETKKNLRLISTGKLVRRSDDLAFSVGQSAQTANDLLSLFGEGIATPELNPQTIVQFAEFLNGHIFKALEVSTAAHLMATAKDADQRGEIRRLFINFLGGKESNAAYSLVPWSREGKMAGAAILAQDPHFVTNYQPILMQLNELGNQTEEQIRQAEEARKQALKNQGRITTSFLKGAKDARAAHAVAQRKRTALDILSDQLTKNILTHIDVVEDTTIDDLIKKMNFASRDESHARVKEAKARDRAGVALVSFLPAVGATETITTGQVGLYLIDQMINTAFLFSVACYQADISLALQIACNDSVDAFKGFMIQAAERRKLLYARVQEMKNVIKNIPSETGGLNG